MNEQPPASAYTQATAYAPMEAAVADLVEALPEFPGFERRVWAKTPCSRGGVDDPRYTNVEIEYRFSKEDSQTAKVREQYIDALREHWLGLGLRIVADRPLESRDRTDHDLVAYRPEDGVKLWYSVAFYASVRVRSGCVPVSDLSEIEYVPPTGGILPGGRRDLVSSYFPDGIPEQEAVNPFASPDDFEDQL
ncbi:hypothetical protein AB0B28_03505 [Glycomyces sp. NPDC046736]|uniref:hypothetical protein n=1 Tax=Glycomyces sp. NPDC046736 TaxID=3155615 RepID=UPI0033CCAE34